jgi:hypothetical protein
MKTVAFESIPHPRYITVDPFGRIWPVTNLYDQFSNDAEDPALAISCVVKIDDDDRWISGLVEDYPVYTAH